MTEVVVVSELTPCTVYTFRVQAKTSKGPGPWSNITEVQTNVTGKKLPHKGIGKFFEDTWERILTVVIVVFNL